MKKISTILLIFSSLILFNSCEKNVIKYIAEPIPENSANIKIFNDVNTSSSSTENNLTRVMLNDQTYSNVATSLGGALPSGSVRFYNVPSGPVKMDLFRGDGDVKDNVYSKTFNVSKGDWAAFVYDLNLDPMIVEVPKSFERFIMEDGKVQDTICHINFVNLLYKSDGVTPFGKITLKVSRKIDGEYIPWETVGTVDFGEETGFVPIRLYRKGVSIWSGTESGVDISLFDENGDYVKRFTSSTQKDPVDYIGTGYSLAKGRAYYFHFNGRQGTSYGTQVIRMSTHAVL